MNVKILLVAAFATSLFLSGCDKDDDKPQPVTPVTPSTKGSLTMIASPANAAVRINIIRGTDTIKATPDAYGVFNVAGIEANNYNVVFTPAPFYDAPTDRTAVIKAEQVTDFGTVAFTKKPDGIAAKVNGANWKPNFYDNYIDSTNKLTIYGFSYGGHYVYISGIPFAIGTYKNTSNSSLHWGYGGYFQGGPNERWDGIYGGNVTVTITQVNLPSKTVSGYYNFTANPELTTTATGVIKVTEGVFINASYQ